MEELYKVIEMRKKCVKNNVLKALTNGFRPLSVK
jgi:hypothetical protein